MIIGSIIVVMLVSGAVISGDIFGPVYGFRNQNLGYTLLGLAGDIILAYFIIDVLLLRDERQRWKAVKDRVAELVKVELKGILDEVMLVSRASLVAVTFPRAVTEEEAFTVIRRARLDRMKELSRDLDLLKETVDPLLVEGSKRQPEAGPRLHTPGPKLSLHRFQSGLLLLSSHHR